MSESAFLRSLLSVEQEWLHVLGATGIAPAGAVQNLTELVHAQDLDPLATDAESGGNPVMPLVRLLRERLPEPAASWLHRGLTSQDVVDTALMLCARKAVAEIREQLDRQAGRLVSIIEVHRGTPMVARTLTQYAVPTTFGAKAASWLQGVLDADDELAALRFPAQLGGAAGTLSGLVELGGVRRARQAREELPRRLGLVPAPPWHSVRTPVTRIADAAVLAGDCWGRIANDVLTLSRPEVAELAESAGGGSSTMPQKANPVDAALVRRAALAAPPLAATLHLAYANQVDERAAGAWHVEWDTLATLLRRTTVAAFQTTSMLTGLQVREDRMARRRQEVDEQIRAEQRVMAELAAHEPRPSYSGLVEDLVEEILQRAQRRGASLRAATVPDAREGE